MPAVALSRSDFDFELPSELIAQEPLKARASSRLLCLLNDRFEHGRFSHLENYLRPGDLLVLNDTRVIPARLQAIKDTGGHAELLLERIESSDVALCQARVSKALKPGRKLHVLNNHSQTCVREEIRVLGRQGEFYRLQFARSVLEVLQDLGQVPLPPYIQRAPRPEDQSRYQTVFARLPGAVAAPTAGLHFDNALLSRLEQGGITSASITLHVGAGTFQPIRSENLAHHHMHAERVSVGAEVVSKIRQTRERGGRVVAVGTTVVRALESAALNGELARCEGETDLFILPGFKFRVTDLLITNFHLPRSTLLMLVAAFAGREKILNAYQTAIARHYRFFSYGDAMLLQSHQAAIAPTMSRA